MEEVNPLSLMAQAVALWMWKRKAVARCWLESRVGFAIAAYNVSVKGEDDVMAFWVFLLDDLEDVVSSRMEKMPC
eukprot:scaffold54374_cov86-Cyclotella_meneghiniana.AAC.2